MVVLAILALLAGIVIFVVKPGEVLNTVKDTTRVSDLNNISKSINYLNTWAMGNLVLGNSTTIYVSLLDNTSTTCTSWSLPTLPVGYSYSCKNSTTYRLNDGTGWVPINFRESDNSNILSSLPVDPVNNISYYYTYFPGGSFELTAQLTKVREASLNDSGQSGLVYETGTANHVATLVVRDTNLILNFKFSEGTGTTTYDSSGHGYTGTLSGPAWTALTSTEQTLYWDAVGADYISTPSFAIPNTGILTVESWMKSKVGASYQSIIGEVPVTPGFTWVYRYSFADSLHSRYSDGDTIRSVDFNNFFQNFDNQWIYIVTVCDYINKTVKAYRNGVQFDVAKTLTGTPVFPSTNRVRYVGSYAVAPNYTLTDGSLDEVRIYNRGLSAEEVMARYNQTRGRYQ